MSRYLGTPKYTVAIILCIMLLFSSKSLGAMQTPVTPLPTGSTLAPQPSPTAIYNPTSDVQLSYQEALDYYLRLSTEVVKSSETSIDLAKFVIGLVGIFTSVATGVVAYIAARTRLAEQAAQRSAESSQQSVHKADELNSKLHEQLAELQKTKEEISQIELELNQLFPDMSLLQTLLLLKSYTVQALDPDETRSEVAVTTLIEYSRDKNPVIRLEALQQLQKLQTSAPKASFQSRILNRLREIAMSDPENLLRGEASNTINTTH